MEKQAGEVHKVGELGRYRLIAELARGGMGVVYLALVGGPGGFNKLFVVKELKAHLVEDPSLVDMFLEEARLSAKLSHPNVVQTMEVGSDGDRHFIAMEFLDGQALHRVAGRTQRHGGVGFPLAYHLHVISKMLEGLQYAHDLADFDGTPLGIVHRDISPHNVFVAYDGQVKLLDFGIAKALDSSSETSTGVLKGKIKYMAPEQVAGKRADRRVDVFASGVMLWEAAAGSRMWDASMFDLQILRALTMGELPKIRERTPNVDPELERIIEKATAIEVVDRYQSAAELQTALDDYLQRLPDGRVGPREIGKAVSELFATERAKMNTVIDEQLRLVRGASTGQYGAIDLPRLSPLGTTGSGTPATGSALTGAGMSGTSASVVASGISVVFEPPAQWWKKAAIPLAVGVVIAGVAVGVGATFAIGPRAPAPTTDSFAGQNAGVAPAGNAVPIPPSTIAVPAPRTAVAPPAGSSTAAETPSTKPADDEPVESRHGSTPGRVHGKRAGSTPLATAPAASGAKADTPPPSPTAERNRQQIDTTDPYAR